MAKNQPKAIAFNGANSAVGAAKAETVMESMLIPASLLLAAETVAMRGEDEKIPASTKGVHIVQKGDRGRVVATDFSRAFIASFPLKEGKGPTWLDKGLMLFESGLKARITMLRKLHGEFIRVDYVAGSPSALISDPDGEDVFKVAVLAGACFEYEKTFGLDSFMSLDDDGLPDSKEWQPIGFNSAHLKHISEVANMLESGLDKKARSKNGMTVRSFNSGKPNAPMIFDFETVGGAILVVGTQALPDFRIAGETAKLIEAPVKLTIGALRAHATRWRQRAEAATNETDRTAFLARVADFEARAGNVARTASSIPGIESLVAKAALTIDAKPEAKPEADEAAADEAKAEDVKPETIQPETQPIRAAAAKMNHATKRNKQRGRG